MKCREAKQEIALHAGHDSPDQARWDEVRRHVAGCESCRNYYGRMKSALALIEQADAPRTYEVRGSLWSRLESRIGEPTVVPRRDRATWISLTGVAVACLLFVSVWTTTPQEANDPAQRRLPRQALGPLPGLFHDGGPRPSREAREAAERARSGQQNKHKEKTGQSTEPESGPVNL